MSTRRAVTDTLERLAFAAELLDDPRGRAYGTAAWAIRNLEGDPAELRERGELEKVKGVGKGVLAAIDAVIRGEKPEALEEMEAKLPEGLFAIRRIKGLGPKKVKALFSGLGITTLGELEYACRENRLVGLDGFGKKTQASVLEQIARIRETEGLYRRDQAGAVLAPVVSALEAIGLRAQIVGEHRRGLELVRELAVLVEGSSDPGAARAALDRARPPEVLVALHTAEASSFCARSVWLSSSGDHREALRARAAQRGLVLDESGLMSREGPVRCETEDALYRALGLLPTAPERREPGVPLVLTGKASPRLVTRADLRGALHNHTVASDGSATLAQMREAAAERGLGYLGISEHSHSAFYARGLDVERLRAQVDEIAKMNAKASPCALLSGVESDILQAGELDYDDEVLCVLDVIVASVHRRHSQDREQMTRRMVAAASHPLTDVVGHPTGRLLLGRAPSVFDVEAFLDACASNGVAVELNANPHRLDLNETHLGMAKERGLLVSISADAHATGELDNLEHGITIARRAGLTPEDVLNARALDELRAWLAARRARAARAPQD
jgi:DNA polymerase (family 10)